MATANKNLFPDLSNPNAEYYQVYKPTYSTTPSYTAPTSYSGQQSSLGNITGVAPNKTNDAYTGFADNARASGTAGAGGQVNMYTAPGGSVYNTSNMTPQQIHALSLNKENNPNAAAILAGMGLDINGNQKIKSPWEQGLDRLRDNFAQSTGNTYNYQTGAYTSPTSYNAGGGSYSVPQNGGYIPPASASEMKASQTSTLPAAATGILSTLSGNQFAAPTSANGYVDQATQKRAAERQPIYSLVSSTKAAKQRDYEYAQKLKAQERAKEDASFERDNNPFSGRTSYAKGQLASSRELTDAEELKNYNAIISGLDQQLIDFDMASPAAIREYADQLEDKQFKNAVTVAGLTGNYNGQRTLQGSQYDLGVQDQLFNQGIKEANTTGVYQPYQPQIDRMNNNSIAWHSASPEQRKILEAENRSIASQIGATQDAQGNWVMPQASPTLEAIKTQFESDKYWTTFQENVRQFGETTAIEKAYKEGQLSLQQAAQAIDKYQAETSRMGTISSANTAAERLAWEKDPNNPDNKYKTYQASGGKEKSTDYKTSPEFAADIDYLKSNPKAATQLDSNAQSFISAYGYDGYLALRKAAGLD